MQKLFRFAQTGLLIGLILGSACRPAASPAPTVTPQASPSPTHPSRPASPTALVKPSPSATLKPTATPAPTGAEPPVALLAEGPWLAYLPAGNWSSELISVWGNLAPLDLPLTTSVNLVKADGTGHVFLHLPLDNSAEALALETDAASRLAVLGGRLYLIWPQQATGKFINQWGCAAGHFCHSLDRNAQSGLLASYYRAAAGAPRELLLYTWPAGKLHARLLLDKCVDCADEATPPARPAWPSLDWSPSGQFLTVGARLEGASPALYVYTVKTDTLRRLADARATWSAWWSPAEDWFIRAGTGGGELEAVSLKSGATRRLPGQSILGWLDNERGLVYSGNLANAVEDGGYSLYLVDLNAGEPKLLFDDGFLAAEIDYANETVAVLAQVYNGVYASGIYLVSPAQPAPRLVTDTIQYGLEWEPENQVFLTDVACAPESKGYQAFDSQGVWSCVLRLPPPAWNGQASPDGLWRAASKEDGVWVERDGKPAQQVSPAHSAQIIWNPDSSGFFFVADKILYHVAVPELAVRVVDDQLGADWIDSAWLQ